MCVVWLKILCFSTGNHILNTFGLFFSWHQYECLLLYEHAYSHKCIHIHECVSTTFYSRISDESYLQYEISKQNLGLRISEICWQPGHPNTYSSKILNILKVRQSAMCAWNFVCSCGMALWGKEKDVFNCCLHEIFVYDLFSCWALIFTPITNKQYCHT